MGWLQKLYETYDNCYGNEQDSVVALAPISHTYQLAQIEIVLDCTGQFRRASVIDRSHANTLIPCSEQSAGRSGKAPATHPLCDKLQYVAGDFIKYGGVVTSGFSSDPELPHRAFLKTLTGWATSQFSHTKLNAILAYSKKGQLISDLVDSQILYVDAAGRLLEKWEGDNSNIPMIFKVLSKTQIQAEAFVRWSVEERGVLESATSQDQELIRSWISYYASMQQVRGYCLISGDIVPLATQHPAKLRHGGDKAKLISSNDNSGFTFKGKFFHADEAVTVGYETTQKAHNALRWLIKRQGYRNGGQAIVCWSVGGADVPDPFRDTMLLLEFIDSDLEQNTKCDTSQAFALRLNKAIAGYKAKLNPTDDVVVMGLDSATPGRMAITFYRELKGSEFLDRIQHWHFHCAWFQNFGKDKKFFGAPAPKDIAAAAYGRRLDEKLCSSTVERLLPCIIDGQTVPFDLVESIFKRTCNRVGMENWEWEKCLGIVCALYKAHHKNRGYTMTLETRSTRDYLYGRLLAIADNIESMALHSAGEKRDTTASRLMQRFASHPHSTWRNIELALAPYISRLRSNKPAILVKREKLLDEVMTNFQVDDFINDAPLSCEFLLGFHCQREELWRYAQKNIESESGVTVSETEAATEH